MKSILDAPFMVEMIRTTTNMYNHGWDERNGGNISLLLDEAVSSTAVRRQSCFGALLTAANSPASSPPT